MNIIVNGAGGRMGQVLCSLIEQNEKHTVTAKVSAEFETDAENHIYKNIDLVTEKADVIIDFSHHSAAPSLCDYAAKNHTPLVIATTGFTKDENEAVLNASFLVPIFKSGNMSLGVALVAKLAQIAAKAFPTADIEIIEKHHNQKLDVPSGTALLIADSIKEARPEVTYNIGRHEDGKRKENEIGIHSLRLGNEVGTHEVIIAAGSQTITVKHESENRQLFAEGAVSAAEFLVKQENGLYDMNDIF